MIESLIHTHYVYYVTYNDVIIYIGKGMGNRYMHVNSGISHNYKLNEYYFRSIHFNEHKPIVKILKGFLKDSLTVKTLENLKKCLSLN